MDLIERAKALRLIIEQAAQSLDDKTASTSAELFPRLKQDGCLVPAGTRIEWRGKIKRATVDLWDAVESDPDHAPALWVDIEYRDGYRIAPETFTAVNAAAQGECMWFGDVLYESLMAGNVYTPEQAPNAWKMIE
jgi:hypothetical protein